MRFPTWLRNRLRTDAGGRRRGHGAAHPRATVRPRVEALEGRRLLSQINLTVSSLADAGPGTLRAAILAADVGKPSDKFTIGVSVTGTIDLQSPLPDLNNTIAIQGPGASSLTVERAAGASFSSAIVTVDPGQTASLSGLTIANGDDGGIANYGGTLTVSGCTISGNSGLHFGFVDGGGIDNAATGTLTVSGCIISGNSAFNGGGIWNAGTLTISTSMLSGNGASDVGGGILNYGTLTVTASTVSGNSAAVGGGIDNLGSATVQQGSTLSGNSAGSGGAIVNGGTLTVSGSTLSGNSAPGFNLGGVHSPGKGGGIFNLIEGTLKVSNYSTLSGNSADSGGGLFNAGAATLQDSTLSGNTATEGGGIDNYVTGTLTVQDSSLSGNTAGDSGGGLYNLCTATVQQSSLSGNTAGSDGGGLFNGASGALAVKDSTVLGNTAPSGADLYNLGVLALDDSTVGVIGP